MTDGGLLWETMQNMPVPIPAIIELEKLGIKVYPGEADFLLLKTDDPLYEKLLKKKILIRDCSNYRGLCTGYYRIAVKTHKENEKLIAQLKDTMMDKCETLQSVN